MVCQVLHVSADIGDDYDDIFLHPCRRVRISNREHEPARTTRVSARLLHLCRLLLIHGQRFLL